ncbi:MAG: hypothetical protein JRF71_04380 [Deltaproteobacteria bacterium]|nr:hypothetical protein [Deltaproteobacteria bacterium]MBW2200059.1 hypothetical protein [Deltaproteobacteria bacterium]
MNSESETPAMNQKIFNMGLSVETISVYLLCCGFSDSGTIISTKNLMGAWNGTEKSLSQGLSDLEKRNILRRIIFDQKKTVVYHLTDVKDWKIN